jgi:hypothetical protein
LNPDEAAGQDLSFHRSSFCNDSGCVEVAVDGDSVVVRDSKNPDQEPLRFTSGEWEAFKRGVAAGEF